MPGLAAAARPAVTQPLSRPVPADDAAYWARKGPLKLAFRNARRRLGLAASGQSRLLRPRIEPGWRRCLWIHAEAPQLEAPQLGDTLMDLAPRSLLREHGIEVDLLAAPHLASLFEGDRWLGRCVADGAALGGDGHDFAIVTSHAARALAPKMQFAPRLPWISLAGYYSVPDYHRSLFNTRRLADCLGRELDAAALRLHSRQKLDPTETGEAPAAAEGTTVGLAIGGVRADRTYRHWPELLCALHAAGVSSFVLAGSANGLDDAAAIARAAPAGTVLHDTVARTDLPGTRAALAACDLVVCADGGLMHLAFTTAVAVVPLFTRSIDPAWRLPLDFDGEALRSATPEVSDIAVGEVAAAALRCLGRQPLSR